MSRRHPFDLNDSLEDSGILVNPGEDRLDFEESFMDGDAVARLERASTGRPYPKSITLLTITLFVFLVGRLYYLTVSKYDDYRAIAEGNRLRIEYVPAPRGTAFDSRGEILASNKPSFEIVAIPLDLPKDDAQRQKVIAGASQILQMPSDEITKIIANGEGQVFQSVLVKQNIQREQALIFQEREGELPGFRIVNTPIRDYNRTPAALAHLLGYVGKLNPDEYKEKRDLGYLFNDSIGKTGLEFMYENDLRGQFGERQVEVDARGIVKRIFGEKKAVPGDNIILNIDAQLQDKAYELMAKRLRALNRSKAAVIAMDPRSGRILSYISLPGFDNNVFAEGISSSDYAALAEDEDQPLFNRAIGGIYPPGSTVKPMVSIAALEEQIITQNTIIRDEGAIVIENIYGGPDSIFIGYGRKALGLLDVRKAIALSSDIFYYIVSGGFGPANIEGMGINKLARWYREFKIGEKLGIDLPGEQAGLVPDPEWKQNYFEGDEFSGKWYLGDTYHAAIGQGDLLASPLHVLSWTATIANGGKIWRPFFVGRGGREGGGGKRNEPHLLGELPASAENIKIAQEGMRMAATGGTAITLSRLPITSAAKTGTAQFDARNRNRSHAWFTAYAPYEDPQIAITAIIEDGGEGGINTAPVVREILDWWAKNRYQK